MPGLQEERQRFHQIRTEVLKPFRYVEKCRMKTGAKLSFRFGHFISSFWNPSLEVRLEAERCFSVIFSNLPLVPPPQISIDEDCLRMVNSTGLLSGLDSQVQIQKCV